MAKTITDDIIKAGIDKRVKDLIEPRIGAQAYTIAGSLITGYIKTLLEWAKNNEYEIK